MYSRRYILYTLKTTNSIINYMTMRFNVALALDSDKSIYYSVYKNMNFKIRTPSLYYIKKIIPFEVKSAIALSQY